MGAVELRKLRGIATGLIVVRGVGIGYQTATVEVAQAYVMHFAFGIGSTGGYTTSGCCIQVFLPGLILSDGLEPPIAGEVYLVIAQRLLDEETFEGAQHVIVVDGAIYLVAPIVAIVDHKGGGRVEVFRTVEAGIGVADEVPRTVAGGSSGILLQRHRDIVGGEEAVLMLVVDGCKSQVGIRIGQGVPAHGDDETLAGMNHAVIGLFDPDFIELCL